MLVRMLATVVLLGGCGLFSSSREARMPASDLHHLQVGMDADELRDLIGSPDHVKGEPDGSDRWTYRYGGDERLGRSTIVVHVRDGQVRTWEEHLDD